MKKLIMGAFALFLTISVFAQNSKVVTAFSYLQEYNRPSESSETKTKGDPKNLEQAAKTIDEAIADPSTSGSWKAWWYRAQIYQTLESEPSLTSKYPTSSLEAIKSFQRLKEINDPKFKDWNDAYTNLNALAINTFNDGVSAYQKKNYHDAYAFFYGVSDVYDILQAKGQKVDSKILNTSLTNAALAAENENDNAKAISIYKKILANSPDPKTYIILVSLLKKTKDIDSAKKYTDAGLEKYPTESDLLVDKINFFWADEKFNDVIPFIIKASALDPKNAQLVAYLGMAYDQTNDSVNARLAYLKALSIDSNNVEANRGMGGMIFNRSKSIQDQMNALGTSKEDMKKNEELKLKRNAIFLESKPFLEKALKGNPNDEEIKRTLNIIDIRTKN